VTELRVADIVARDLVTIPSTGTVLEAAKLMVQNNLGLLVVCDPNDRTRLLGVVSERDIIRSIASGDRLPPSVAAITTQNPITVEENSDVAEAAKAMNKHGIRHVVVVNARRVPIGVVSMRDLVGERATLNAILKSDEKEVFVGGD
jgi:CBS domain-containing protein